MIQHYPPVKQITKSYSNGKVPTTQDPYAELEATPEPLTDIELQALVICKADGRVSVSKVQRVLCIGYNEAGEICQSIIDKGQCDDLELAPSLTRRAAMYRNGEKVDTSDTTCIEGHPV